MKQEGEPSVEEILDSIKKVIARDNRADAAVQRRHRETDGVLPVADVEDDPFEHGEVLDLAEDSELSDGHAGDGDAAGDGGEREDIPLVTEQARVSMQQSLEALALISEPSVRPQIVRSGETSLEELTRDLLRPALADWLDRNLPPLVERMVAAEISRIIGKRG